MVHLLTDHANGIPDGHIPTHQAITFTRNAAEEMRKRLSPLLRGRAAPLLPSRGGGGGGGSGFVPGVVRRWWWGGGGLTTANAHPALPPPSSSVDVMVVAGGD